MMFSMKYLLLIVLIQNILLADSAKFDRWHQTAAKLDTAILRADLTTSKHKQDLVATVDRSIYANGNVKLTSESIAQIWVKATDANYQSVVQSITSVITARGCYYVNGIDGTEQREPGYLTSKESYSTFVQCATDLDLINLYSDDAFFTKVIDARLTRNIPIKNTFGASFGTLAAPLKRNIENITREEESEDLTKREISRVFQNYYPENQVRPCLKKYSNYPNWYLDALNNDRGIPDCVTMKETEVLYGCEYVKKEGLTGTIFVIDTGVDLSHPEFKWGPAIVTVPILNSADIDEANGETKVNDHAAHGTAIVAMIVGENHGTAKKTKIYSMKIAGYSASWLPSYAFPTAMKNVFKLLKKTVKRPHLIVSGFTHNEEAAPCGWYFSAFSGPLSTSNCAFDSTSLYLEYIYAGGVYVVSSGNGMEYYRDPQYASSPIALGFDICDWGVFSNTYGGYDIYYYPMYLLDGSEFSSYFGVSAKYIRPIVTGSHDKKGYNAKFMQKSYFETGSAAESSTLDFGGSNYGGPHPYNSAVKCVDYHTATSFMESFAVPIKPVLTHGRWEDCSINPCTDFWNGGEFYEKPAGEFFASGRQFPSGYRTGGVSGNSFSTPLVGVALLATMLRQMTYINSLPGSEVSYRSSLLLDYDINYVPADREFETLDDELTNSYASLDYNYGREALEGITHTASSGGLATDIPKNKNVRMRCTKATVPKLWSDINKVDFGS